MALPTNREEFKEYCLRRLGKPVLDINVADNQIEDRIDDAIEFWKEYHYDGTEKVYYKHQITATDVANEYIPLPEELIGVVRILKVSGGTSQAAGLFNVQYQFYLNNMSDLTSGNVSNIWIAMENLQFMDLILNGMPLIDFNKHTDKLYLRHDWSKLTVGDWLIAEGYSTLDPTIYTDIWKDKFLLRYATAKIKQQWGANLIKYDGMQLPGGVSFNGRQYYDDATNELQELEEEMLVAYSLPPEIMQG